MKFIKTATHIIVTFTKNDFFNGTAQAVIQRMKDRIPKEDREYSFPRKEWRIVNIPKYRNMLINWKDELTKEQESLFTLEGEHDFDIQKWLVNTFGREMMKRTPVDI